jgi:hypothetical protein
MAGMDKVEELLCAWTKQGSRKRNMSRSISGFEGKSHKLRNHQLTTHHYVNPVSQLSFHTRQAATTLIWSGTGEGQTGCGQQYAYLGISWPSLQAEFSRYHSGYLICGCPGLQAGFHFLYTPLLQTKSPFHRGWRGFFFAAVVRAVNGNAKCSKHDSPGMHDRIPLSKPDDIKAGLQSRLVPEHDRISATMHGFSQYRNLSPGHIHHP